MNAAVAHAEQEMRRVRMSALDAAARLVAPELSPGADMTCLVAVIGSQLLAALAIILWATRR